MSAASARGNCTWPRVRSFWHDGKKKRVEDSLNDFISHLYLTEAALKKYREDMIQTAIKRQEEESRRLEEQRRRWEEEEHGKRIEDKLRRWRLAQDARAYADEVRRLLAESGRTVEAGSRGHVGGRGLVQHQPM